MAVRGGLLSCAVILGTSVLIEEMPAVQRSGINPEDATFCSAALNLNSKEIG